MENSTTKKQIRKEFKISFGEFKLSHLAIIANNNHSILEIGRYLGLEKTSTRIKTSEMKQLGKYLIDTANELEKDRDFNDKKND